jgi:hypothetical protein
MIVGLSVVAFVVTLCLAAGLLFGSRVGRTTGAKIVLGLVFGFVFLIALTGMAVAGCVVLITTAN